MRNKHTCKNCKHYKCDYLFYQGKKYVRKCCEFKPKTKDK